MRQYFFQYYPEKLMNMRYLLYILLFIFSIDLIANPELDSIAKSLPKVSGKDKVTALLRLGELSNTVDLEKALTYSNDALELAKKSGDKSAQSQALLTIGISYALKSNFQKSHEFLQKSLQLAIEIDNKKVQATCLNALGNINKEWGNFVEAFSLYDKAYDIRLALRDSIGLASMLNNIGLLYYSWGNFDKAVEYYEKSLYYGRNNPINNIRASTYLNLGNIYLEIQKPYQALEMFRLALSLREKDGDLIGIGMLYTNIGNTYMNLKHYDTAMIYHYKSLDMAVKKGDKGSEASAYANIGITEMNLGNFSESIINLNKSIAILRQLQRPFALSTVLNNVAIYYIKVKEFNNALRYLQESQEIALKQNYKVIMRENFLYLSECYELTGNFKKSLEYHKQYSALHDTLFNEKISKKLNDMEIRYQIEKREKENEQEKLLLRKENEKQETITYLLISLIILMAITIIGIYNRFVYRKRINSILENTNSELQDANASKDKYLAIINHEMMRAAHYVVSIIPQPINTNELQTFWRFIPSEKLGGDAFGYHWIDENHFSMYLLDVSGHGISSAIHSTAVLNTLKSEALTDTNFTQPDRVLTSLNNYYQMKKHSSFFFTIWYGVYNKLTRELRYSSAGHSPAFIIDDNGYSEKLTTGDVFLGGVGNYEYKSKAIIIERPSRLYIFSDGVYEIQNSKSDEWELDGFYEFLTKISTNDDSDLEEIYQHSLKLNQTEQLDDDFSLLKIVIR